MGLGLGGWVGVGRWALKLGGMNLGLTLGSSGTRGLGVVLTKRIIYSAQAGAPRYGYLEQGDGHPQLVRERHLRAHRDRGVEYVFALFNEVGLALIRCLQSSHHTRRSRRSRRVRSRPLFASSFLVSLQSTPSRKEPSRSPRFVPLI